MQHLSNEQLNNYSRRKMSVREMLETDKHLATCDECRHQLKAESSLSVLIKNYQETAKAKITHLTFEELSGYVKKNLDLVEREIVESHVEHCRRCAKELKDLQAFVLTLNEETKTQKSFLQTFLAKIGFSTKESSLFGLPQWAGVMGAVVVFIGAAFLFIFYSSFFNQSNNSSEIAQNRNLNLNFNKPTPMPSPQVSPLPNNQNQNKEPNPIPTPRKASKAKVEEPTSAIATIILLPSGTRDGNAKKTTIEKNVKTVRLVIGVKEFDYKNFKVVLKPVGGDAILTKDNLKPRRMNIVLYVPSNKLPTDDYLLVLNGVNEQGELEPLSTISLRIRRK